MGRTPEFDAAAVVDKAAQLFADRGFSATSVDDLVTTTGVHRGSLYKTFGSKRGLFLVALETSAKTVEEMTERAHLKGHRTATLGALLRSHVLDLFVIAAVEMPHDREIADVVAAVADRVGAAFAQDTGHSTALVVGALLFGGRLLSRLATTPPLEKAVQQLVSGRR